LLYELRAVGDYEAELFDSDLLARLLDVSGTFQLDFVHFSQTVPQVVVHRHLLWPGVFREICVGFLMCGVSG
jgi:hypothetical protein